MIFNEILIGVWDHFDKTEIDASGKRNTVKCHYCDVSYKFGSTTSLKEHLSKRNSIKVFTKTKEDANDENEVCSSSKNEEESHIIDLNNNNGNK